MEGSAHVDRMVEEEKNKGGEQPVELVDEELVEEAPATVAKGMTPARGDLGVLEPEEPYKKMTKRAFGRFELLIEMGRGGMATLYLARLRGPEQFEKLLAIKKIHDHLADEREFVDMFLDEARIAALIHHPNVATIFEFGALDKSYFIAMEYVHGQNLTDILKNATRRPESLPWEYAVRIVADAAKGLHAAHELKNAAGVPLNVVHRDVSPQNILLSYDGHVKVVDFGIAYAAEKVAHTATGQLKGKAAYMSPEQTAAERLDRRSDIFSLGTVLYETALIKRLFKEDNEAATLLRVREADVPRPRQIRSDIPAELERIILRALARDPVSRFSTAEELADQLEELLVAEGKVVSRQKIARLMDDFFFDRKRIKDEQIQRAMKDNSTEPMKGVAMGSSTSSISLLSHPSVGKRRLGGPVLVISVVVAVVALAGLLFALLRPGQSAGEKKSEPAPMALAMAPPAMKAEAMTSMKKRPERVSLSIRVSPEKAPVEITFQGQTHHGAVLKTRVRRSTTPQEVAIRAKGYEPRSLMVVPSEDSEIPVTLTPLPEKPMRPSMRRYSPMRRRPRSPMLKEIMGW